MSCSFICLSPSPDPANCNKLIKKQFHQGNAKGVILSYINMQELGFQGDNYSFPVLLKAVSGLSSSSTGLAIHGQTIKSGLSDHPFVQTSLLNMYVAYGCLFDACKVFDKMPVKDVIAWNSMLDAYASSGQMNDAMELFNSMPSKDLTSFNIMVSGYARSGRTESARDIFDKMRKKDIVSWNSILLAHSRDGEMEKAREVFDEMPKKNIITWNTMINGYLHAKLYTEVIDLFDAMMTRNLKIDHLTVTGVLSACTHMGSLEKGNKIHLYAKDNGLESNPHVATALIEMYAKCGSIKNSMLVFYKCQVKDIYCWNATISALAAHGYGFAALKIFYELVENCLTPDDITFIGVLNACSHAGLVQEGCKLFTQMEKDFGIVPKIEHYGCMVDLLGRAGLLDSAMELIEGMPFEPGKSVWGALLNACVIHQNIQTGEKVIDEISKKASLGDGEFMMFANLYAACGQLEEANRWREMMNETGIVKTAGFSAVEINGRFHKFLARTSISKGDHYDPDLQPY
ncbi:hypothetical protein SLE2022_185470 [Rubroshorea leprosula]